MSKQLFTPAGVSAKIADLYENLTEEELQAEAEAAKDDFSGWLNDNFDFSIPQSEYLGAIDPGFLDSLGNQFSLALGNRLPIILIEPTPIDPDDYSSKVIHTEEQPALIYNSTAGFTVTGSLIVNISLLTS